MKLRTRRRSIAVHYPSVEQRRAAAKRERYARDIKFYGGAKWTKRQQRAMRGVAKAPFVFNLIGKVHAANLTVGPMRADLLTVGP